MKSEAQYLVCCVTQIITIDTHQVFVSCYLVLQAAIIAFTKYHFAMASVSNFQRTFICQTISFTDHDRIGLESGARHVYDSTTLRADCSKVCVRDIVWVRRALHRHVRSLLRWS